MESRLLIAEPDPDSDQILVFSVTARCKRLIVKVGDKEVVIERQKDRLIVKKDGAYTTKRVTIKYPSKPYLFYTKTADGAVEIEAEALY
jgi:hypothetical protein